MLRSPSVRSAATAAISATSLRAKQLGGKTQSAVPAVTAPEPESEEPESPEDAQQTVDKLRNQRNYRITDEYAAEIGKGGEITKLKANLDALELLKAIQSCLAVLDNSVDGQPARVVRLSDALRDTRDYAVASTKEALRGELDKLRDAGKISPELDRAFRGEATPDAAGSGRVGQQNLPQDDAGAAGQDEAGRAGQRNLGKQKPYTPTEASVCATSIGFGLSAAALFSALFFSHLFTSSLFLFCSVLSRWKVLQADVPGSDPSRSPS